MISDFKIAKIAINFINEDFFSIFAPAK